MTEIRPGNSKAAGGPPTASSAGPAAPAPARSLPSTWALAGVCFVVAALVLAMFVRGNPAIGTLSITFVSIVLEALPFVMLGSLIGGLIEVFVSRDRITALLPRNVTAAVFVAACMGIVLPVCECAIIPVTRRLLGKGVPFSVAVAYLIAGPIVNPLVAGSTAVAYSGDPIMPAMVVTRLLCGFTIAVFVARLMDEVFPGRKALVPGAVENKLRSACDHGCGCGHEHDHAHDHEHAAPQKLSKRCMTALEHGADDFLHVSQFLIIGAFVAALSQTVISREAFLSLAETPSASIGVMMLLAVVLNLCSEADAFVAASFRTSLPAAAQMAFLVLGPMLDLKLIAMYLSFVRKRALTMMILLMVGLVFGMMLTLSRMFVGWGAL